MVCQNVGAANPDIAGIGIVVAFAFQAIFAYVISVFGEVIVGAEVTDNFTNEEATIETKPAVVSVTNRSALSVTKDSRQAIEELRREALRNVLLACSNIQTMIGISLTLTGIVRYNNLTLYQYHIIYDSISFVSISNCAAIAFFRSKVRKMKIEMSLVVGFLVLYIVFVILFGIRLRQWDDTREGYCYNARGIAAPSSAHPMVDEVYLALTCLYMCTAYNLVARSALADSESVSTWNELYSRLPQGYRSRIDNLDDLSHGVLSIIFTGIRGQGFAWAGLWDNLYQKIVEHRPSFSKNKRIFSIATQILTRALRPGYDVSTVLLLALAQLPLHLYFLIRLLLSNESLLQEGDTENEWGFGQIYALVSSAAILTECARSLDDYRTKRKELLSSSTTTQQQSFSGTIHHFDCDIE